MFWTAAGLGSKSGPVSILLCRAFLSSNISSEMLVLHKCSMIFVARRHAGLQQLVEANAAARATALAIYEQLKAKHPDVMLSSPLEEDQDFAAPVVRCRLQPRKQEPDDDDWIVAEQNENDASLGRNIDCSAPYDQ